LPGLKPFRWYCIGHYSPLSALLGIEKRQDSAGCFFT
jgi:hypothetical protein